MKTIVLTLPLLSMLLFSGCATRVVQDGISYEALSKKEIAHLVLISRASLKNSLQKKLISRAEYRFALRNEPSVRIQYRGDRFGTASILWRTPVRVLEFRYDEDLTDEIIRKCSFSTYSVPKHERGEIKPDKSIKGR
ncbi:MAG: hypothetical protein E7058_08940 [Lentisphaerae bacterium]|nr:hypothetical protein [Lentisphaerota bacterium]